MQHKQNMCKVVASTSAASQNNDASKVTSFFTKKSASSPGYGLAKLTALDRIPFATLANSEEIRNVWKAQGLSIPVTENGSRLWWLITQIIFNKL